MPGIGEWSAGQHVGRAASYGDPCCPGVHTEDGWFRSLWWYVRGETCTYDTVSLHTFNICHWEFDIESGVFCVSKISLLKKLFRGARPCGSGCPLQVLAPHTSLRCCGLSTSIPRAGILFESCTVLLPLRPSF